MRWMKPAKESSSGMGITTRLATDFGPIVTRRGGVSRDRLIFCPPEAARRDGKGEGKGPRLSRNPRTATTPKRQKRRLTTSVGSRTAVRQRSEELDGGTDQISLPAHD